MATDNKLKELVINTMTKAQYDALTTKDPNEIYAVTDAKTGAQDLDTSNVGTVGQVLSKTDTGMEWSNMFVDGMIPAERMIKAVELVDSSVELAINTIYNAGEIASLSITFPTVDVRYTSQLNFTSGATPTTVTASNIVWVGDNVSETVGFVPRANCRYTVMFMYDGSNIRGIIQGVSL